MIVCLCNSSRRKDIKVGTKMTSEKNERVENLKVNEKREILHMY